MSFAVSARIARRELRGGLRGFRVFLACLALGVAAIAGVGMVRESIQLGLTQQGSILLGGDAEIQLTYRTASVAERNWMQSNATAVSEIIDFRSMVVVGDGESAERGLTQVKAVDTAYPLTGTVHLEPDMPLDVALDGQDGLPGAVMDGVLVDRLGLAPGAEFRLGTQSFVLTAVLAREPDNAGGGFSLGPRTIVRTPDLKGSGLLTAGSLYEAAYRLKLVDRVDLDALEQQAKSAIQGGGLRWRDRRNGAPGMTQFVDRLGTFLILVGLAGLAVGGVGVFSAVRSYLGEKVQVIATLKSLGADGRTVFQIYLIQIATLTIFGIVIGLVIGSLIPLVLGPVIQSQLPVPAVIGVHATPLFEAAIYGALAAALFTIWPLARTEDVRAATLFRDASLGARGWPRFRYVVLSAMVLIVLVLAAIGFTGEFWLTAWAAFGILAAFLMLVVSAFILKILARAVSHRPAVRRFVSLRLALASIGGPGGEAVSVVLSLGLGLSVLAAVGQVETNLRSAIDRDLPKVAPSYFVVDIQDDQIGGFVQRLELNAGVSRIQTAPMLRGVITKINDRPAQEVAGDHWVVTGDRGITYSAALPPGAEVTQGVWWPKDYSGPPQISFSAQEAEEIGLHLGDNLTINVLGREITAEISSFRHVDFSSAGMGFVLSMNPAAISGAPHTHIATIYTDQASEAGILRDLATAYPNITAIRVRDAIERVSQVLRGIAAAITYGTIVTLATGVVVLIGAAAAGERLRTYESAVLKTLGASKESVLINFILRSGLLGLAAGLVAIAAGGVAGWAMSEFVFETDFEFAPISAILIIAGGIGATILAGLGFSLRSVNRKPAGVLRARE